MRAKQPTTNRETEPRAAKKHVLLRDRDRWRAPSHHGTYMRTINVRNTPPVYVNTTVCTVGSRCLLGVKAAIARA